MKPRYYTIEGSSIEAEEAVGYFRERYEREQDAESALERFERTREALEAEGWLSAGFEILDHWGEGESLK